MHFSQDKDDNRIIRTDQYNSKWLNSPQFVGSFEAGDFVYFVFREAAVEYINCGKVHTIEICVLFTLFFMFCAICN